MDVARHNDSVRVGQRFLRAGVRRAQWAYRLTPVACFLWGGDGRAGQGMGPPIALDGPHVESEFSINANFESQFRLKNGATASQ
jgi:hypothetical protein